MSSDKNNQRVRWTAACPNGTAPGTAGVAYPALTVANASVLPLLPGVFVDGSRYVVADVAKYKFAGNAGYFSLVAGDQAGGKFTIAPAIVAPSSGATFNPHTCVRATLALNSVEVEAVFNVTVAAAATVANLVVLGFDAAGAAWTVPVTASPSQVIALGGGIYSLKFSTGYIPRGYSFFVGISSTLVITALPVSCSLDAQPEKDGRD